MRQRQIGGAIRAPGMGDKTPAEQEETQGGVCRHADRAPPGVSGGNTACVTEDGDERQRGDECAQNADECVAVRMAVGRAHGHQGDPAQHESERGVGRHSPRHPGGVGVDIPHQQLIQPQVDAEQILRQGQQCEHGDCHAEHERQARLPKIKRDQTEPAQREKERGVKHHGRERRLHADQRRIIRIPDSHHDQPQARHRQGEKKRDPARAGNDGRLVVAGLDHVCLSDANRTRALAPVSLRHINPCGSPPTHMIRQPPVPALVSIYTRSSLAGIVRKTI